jgi:hypothetical protein
MHLLAPRHQRKPEQKREDEECGELTAFLLGHDYITIKM